MKSSAGFVLLADEPADLGGTNMGPTPIELLAASLASCKAITATMYARRKDWPVTNAACTVEYTTRQVEGEPKPVPHLHIEMQFTGELTDEQLARLKEIAERCPVQRLIEGPCTIETVLAQ
jgi:putative redox protein